MTESKDTVYCPNRMSRLEDPKSDESSSCRRLLWRYLALLAAGLAAWVVIYRFLNPFCRWFAFDLLSLSETSHVSSAAEFFVYDTPKVLVLLVLSFSAFLLSPLLTPTLTPTQMIRGDTGWTEWTGNPPIFERSDTP